MDTLSFLQRVLPTDGLYCAMFLEGGKARHGFFGSVEELANASTKLDALNLQTYYAVSTFADRRRKQENVHGTKVVAIDLDVGDTDRKYPTWQDALKDLGRFVSQTQLPKPLVVHSGVGLHAYWVFSETLTPEQWKPLATSMKALATAKGLRIDPTVTADGARVLRAIGTTNAKSGKRVRLLIDAPDVDPDALRGCFGTSAPVTIQPAPQRSSGLASSLAVKYDYPPAAPDAIVNKCAQVRWAVENQNDVAEPMWYTLLGVAAFCKDPEMTAVKWSQDHKDFDPNRTLRKMYQWQGATSGPSTCSRFEDERPAGCKGCKFKGKIGSPARLGVQYDEAPPVAEAPTTVKDVPLPKPFKRTTGGIKLTIDDTDIDVCPFDIYPVSYGRDEALGYEVVRYTWNRVHSGWQPLVLRQALLFDGHREFGPSVADQGIVLNSKKQTEFFQLMLRSYMDALRQKRAMTNLYSTMGWKEDFNQFVIGDTIYKRDASGNVTEQQINMASNANRIGGSMWTQSGSLEDWVAFTNLLQKAQMPWHMFSLMVGISAPLYEFCGLKGATLSLYGETGAGKTLIQYWQQSVWGSPQKLHFAAKFTENALFSRMALLSHMPMTIDETTVLDAKDLGGFLYMVTQGRDKARLNRNAEEREPREWALPVTISTNRPTAMMMTAAGLDTDAQMARLLEVHVPKHSLFTKDTTIGKRIYHFLNTNHGVMGREFIKKLLELGPEGVRAVVSEHFDAFPKQYKVKFAGQERYWEQMIVTADLVGKLCHEWGLIDFEYTLGTQWVLSQLGIVRAAVEDTRRSSRDILAEYLNNYASTAVTVMHTIGKAPQVDSSRVPRGDIRIRFDVYRKDATSKFDRGTLLLDRTHFRHWVATNGGDYKALLNELEANNALATPKSQKASMGKDTPVKLAQCYVVGVTLNHPWFSSILEDADQALEDMMYGQLKLVTT